MASQTVIIVDDSETSQLSYTPAGSWLSQGTIFEYKGTTHGLLDGEGTVQFAFNGTEVEVYGTIAINTTSAVKCTVDGSAIDVEPQTSSSFLQTHQLFCSATLADDKEHKLLITADTSSVQPFYLDYILYHPSTSRQSPGGSLVVDDRQSDQVTFSTTGWVLGGGGTEFAKTTHGTTTPGSSATFDFQGTKVAAYGTVAKDGKNSWVTTYSIDGQTNVPVNSSSYPWTSGAASNMLLYESSDLSDGNHTLTVNFQSGGLEFWLDYFVYTQSPPSVTSGSPSTTPSAQSLPSSSPSSTDTTVPHKSSSSSLSTGAIVGIAVGIGVILLAVALIFLLRRRPKRTAAYPVTPGNPTLHVTPFRPWNVSTGFQGLAANNNGGSASDSTQSYSTRVDMKHRPLPSASSASTSAAMAQPRTTISEPPPYQ